MMKDELSKLQKPMDDLEAKIEVILNLNYLDINVQIDGLDKDKLMKDLLKNSSKKEIKHAVKYVESYEISNYFKCRYISEIACNLNSKIEAKFIKNIIKKAIKYANIPQMYGVAGDYYLRTGDKEYSTKLYKKAIKECLNTGNTSRLHLLGQHMIGIDKTDDEYFMSWGEDIKVAAKRLSDENKQKVRNIKNKLTCKYDTHEIAEVQLTSKMFLKKAIEFLRANAEVAEDEILYVFKALKTFNGEVVTSGAYYGVEMSPLTFLINSKDHSENVFLAEATSANALLEYLHSNREKDLDCNIYVLKVVYKDFKLCKIESFYSGNHNLDFYIFDEYDEESNCYGEVLKRLGKVDYIPSISYF